MIAFYNNHFEAWLSQDRDITSSPSIFPLKGFLTDDVYEARQEKPDEQYDCPESIPAKFPEIDCVRIKEYHFHIEEHEKDRHKEVLDRHRLPRIALLCDPAFKCLKFVFRQPFRTEDMGGRQHHGHKQEGKQYL